MPGPQQTPAENPYRFIVGGNLKYAGTDQGIDFTGAGPVLSPSKMLITRVDSGGTGWPGMGAVVSGRLLDGPRAGQYVYFAEDLIPTVKRGQVVSRGDTIANATGSGQAPGIEIGWALPTGSPLAPRPPARPAPQYTPQGADFLHFVTGGAGPPPVTVGSVAGHIPGVAQVGAAVGAVGSVGDFLGRLADPSYLLRGLQVVAGAVLVLVGVVLLVKQVALAADVDLPNPVKSLPVVRAANAAAAPRRRGDASASRGGEVTRTGAPEPPTRSDRRGMRKNERARTREAAGASAGNDEVPF